MWNIFKKNKEIKSFTAQIDELQSRIKKQNQTIEELTGDRDFWKSQYEKFMITYEPEDAKLGAKIKVWASQKCYIIWEVLLNYKNLKIGLIMQIRKKLLQF